MRLGSSCGKSEGESQTQGEQQIQCFIHDVDQDLVIRGQFKVSVKIRVKAKVRVRLRTS